MQEHVSPQRLLSELGWLRGLARSLVSDGGADDLVQDTMIAALRSPPDPTRPARPWLARVMRNVAAMRYRGDTRRERRNLESELQPAAPAAPDEHVAQVRIQRQLCDVVLALPEPFRKTIVDRYFEGLSPTEIAERDSIPASTVRWRTKEALDRIRKSLDEQSDGDRKRWVAALAPFALPRGGAAAGTGSMTGVWAIAAVCAVVIAAVVGVHELGHRETTIETPARATVANAPAVAPRTVVAPKLDDVPLVMPAPTGDAADPDAALLSHPPARYELTVIDQDGVAVNLHGGRSGVFRPDYAPRAETSPPDHVVIGHVTDASGRPVPGAIVLVGTRLQIRWGQLMADAGATAASDGSFKLVHAGRGELVAMAIDPAGWSAITRVDPAAGELDVQILAGGGVQGTISADGHADRSELVVSPAGMKAQVSFVFETASDGRYALAHLPPGSWELAAGLALEIGGGQSRQETATVAIAAGQSITQDFDIAHKVLIAVRPELPAGVSDDRISTVEAMLLTGHRDLANGAELAQLRRSQAPEAVGDFLVGGVNRHDLIQFLDRDPGTYTVCVEVRLENPTATAFGCYPIELAATPDAREVNVPVVQAP